MQIIQSKWQFDFSDKAQKQFNKLDQSTKIRIRDSMLKIIRSGQNPRTHAKQLAGTLKDLWSFRVGDYRILTQIKDSQLIILAVHISHRRDVYDFNP